MTGIIKGTNNNDTFKGIYGINILDGLSGVDTIDLGTIKKFAITQNTDGTVWLVDTYSSASGQTTYHDQITLKNFEIIKSNSDKSTIDLTTYFPSIVSCSPTEASNNVPIDSPIVLTFNKPIIKGIGNIAIHQSSATGTVLETFKAATDKLLSFSNNTLTIMPNITLTPNTHYFVSIDTGAIKDTSGTNYTATTSYDFTTQLPINTINQPPVAVTQIPAQTAQEGSAFDYDIKQLFSESDGDSLIFTAENLPSWLLLENGFLVGMPGYIAADTPVNTINIIANDGRGATATADLALNISNVATITGTVNADNLLAGSGVDIINGLAGNDTINGGLGNDTLTGGSGVDMFVFNTNIYAAPNIDMITDFVHGVDKIQLSKSGMSNLGAVGVLNSADFKLSTAVQDLSDRIIYNKTTGALWYDADGCGLSVPVQFAIIGLFTHPTLSNADFSIV